MVWSFLLDSTICWQRTEERHFHSYIATKTGLSKRAVETAVVALREAGLIAYEGVDLAERGSQPAEPLHHPPCSGCSGRSPTTPRCGTPTTCRCGTLIRGRPCHMTMWHLPHHRAAPSHTGM